MGERGWPAIRLGGLVWEKIETWRDWATLSEGCYLLHTNITGWSGEDLWKAYMQLG